jgi:hypothetical protein
MCDSANKRASNATSCTIFVGPCSPSSLPMGAIDVASASTTAILAAASQASWIVQMRAR